MSEMFFSRAGRVGPAIAERMPELARLRQATISVFGLGALGAPSAMEFARAGVRSLRVLDFDFVDPATVGRWPFGLQSAGLQKAAVIVNAIERDYPFTEIRSHNYCLGAVQDANDKELSERAVMRDMTDGTSLIFDATAEIGIQQFLSDYAAEIAVPYISVDATPGAWGGRVVRILPGGCWMCYQYALRDAMIPEPPKHADGEVQPIGCSDPTFTGAGFDLLLVAMTAVRVAASTLCAGAEGGYPASGWDVTAIALRDEDGGYVVPRFDGYRLERHPECPRCNPQ